MNLIPLKTLPRFTPLSRGRDKLAMAQAPRKGRDLTGGGNRIESPELRHGSEILDCGRRLGRNVVQTTIDAGNGSDSLTNPVQCGPGKID